MAGTGDKPGGPPDGLPALVRRAADQRRAGRQREAIETYREILGRQPELSDYWFDLGYMLRREGEFDAALEAYGEALRRGVSGPEEVHLNRAVILADELRRDQDALTELRAALALAPNYPPALANLGNLLEEQGDAEGAAEAYRQLRAATTRAGHERHAHLRAECLSRLVHLQAPDRGDAAILVELEAAMRQSGLPAQTRANAGFALGRARDRLGLYDVAFLAIDEANRLARSAGPAYDPVRQARHTDRMIAAFPRAAGREDAPSPQAPQPVFICGLFRSGSTLIEQVLSAHPGVSAGGEIAFLPRLVAGRLAPFPESVAALGEADLQEIARDYSAHLTEVTGGAGGLITDKRPDNFRLIGFIKRLFPEAKVIHTQRDPLDTGLSIYFQHLDQAAAPYSSELAAIGHYFGEYRRLMAHWKALYPQDIVDFDYDGFVADPEPALRELLAALGLDWHPDCLSPERRKNTVKTASYWQVRQPLYRHSSGRWRNYRSEMEPLQAALADAGIETGAG